MERFVRLIAPVGKIDFAIKLLALILLAGSLNHLRDLVSDGYAFAKPYWSNVSDTIFTALPMCIGALLLIGHLNRLQNRLYHQATRDTLTGLPNRRWFMDKTPEMITPQQRMMIVDIDHFKTINDTYGHDVGDLCLRQMATYLTGCLGEGNKMARIGGEEFAALLNSQDDSVTNIADCISQGFSFDTGQGETRQITASVGLAQSAHATARADMLKLADLAVYQAKAAGRARFAIATTPDRNTETYPPRTKSANTSDAGFGRPRVS